MKGWNFYLLAKKEKDSNVLDKIFITYNIVQSWKFRLNINISENKNNMTFKFL